MGFSKYALGVKGEHENYIFLTTRGDSIKSVDLLKKKWEVVDQTVVEMSDNDENLWQQGECWNQDISLMFIPSKIPQSFEITLPLFPT